MSTWTTSNVAQTMFETTLWNSVQDHFMFSFIVQSRNGPLPKQTLRGRTVLGDLLFFPPNSVKWTKRIFIEKSDIFSSQGRSNMLCEMRVAWVWLFQKASACHCLPSQLLQTPVPWLPYMRDQGLPRCFWKRRAHCETGQTSPQKYSFPLHVRCPSGDSDGGHWHNHWFGCFPPLVPLNRSCWLPVRWLVTAICCPCVTW